MKLHLSNRLATLSCMMLVCTGVWFTPAVVSVASANELMLAQAQSRTRIAVLDFDLTDTSGNFFSYSFRGGSLARGISELLTNKLVQNGSYSVVERSRIDAILREQNFGATGRVDSSTAAEIGRILGVDYVILGSVTRFNLEEEEVGGSAGICLPFVGCSIGASVNTRTANVQLTARLVNTTTAEIVAAVEGVGEEEQESGGVSLPIFSGRRSGHNDDSLISDAAEEAVDQLVSQLAGSRTSRSASVPDTIATATSTRSVSEALIADIAGNQVVLNQGTQGGLQVGMKLSIDRVDREITDPQTGEVIRTLTSPIGQIELTDVDDRSSIGKILSGTGFQIGDRAKVTQ